MPAVRAQYCDGMSENTVETRPLSAVKRFWRDVLAQTVSGVMVATIVYLGAVALGYLAAPGVRDIVLFVMALLFPGASISFLLQRNIAGKRTHPLIWISLIVIAVAAFVYSAVLLAASLSAQDTFNGL